MTRLEKITARLDGAIARLEKAIQAGAGAADESHRETAEALRRAREDYAALRQTTDAVGVELDHTMARLRAVLDA